jgi:hypothetical protein
MSDNSYKQEIMDAIQNFKESLEKSKGEKYVKKTDLSYKNGWFVLTDYDGSKSRLRLKSLVALTNELSQSEFDPQACEKIDTQIEEQDRAKKEQARIEHERRQMQLELEENRKNEKSRIHCRPTDWT